MDGKKPLAEKFKLRWHIACGFPPLLLFVGIIIISFASGCGKHPRDAASKSKLDNTLYLGAYPKPEAFIYPMITGSITKDLVDIVFNRLASCKTDGSLLPELAEKWEMLENGRKLVIHLKPGIAFHDGRGLASRDVVFTLRWLRDPARSKRANAFAGIELVTAPDERTVIVSFRKPGVSQSWAVLHKAPIYPAHLFSENPTQEEIRSFGTRPVGTGPFRFESWTEEDTITLAANPHYFQGPPKLDRIVTRTFSSKTHLFSAFVRGEVDLLDHLDRYDYEAIREGAFFQTLKELAPGGYALMFNFKSSVARDLNFRKAVSLGIRRDELVRILEEGEGEARESLFLDRKREGYDPQKAAELLGGQSKRLRLIVEEANFQQMRLAKILRQQLLQIGIAVDLVPVSGLDQTMREVKGSSDWDAVLFMFQTFHDPHYSARFYLQSGGEANAGSYKNKKLELLFEKGDASFEEVIDRDIPICILYSPYNFTVASDQIKGFDREFLSNLTPFMQFRNFERKRG